MWVMAPTFFEIDIALSLRMTMNRLRSREILFKASRDIPQVNVASPMIGMTCSCRLVRSRFFATPKAKERLFPHVQHKSGREGIL